MALPVAGATPRRYAKMNLKVQAMIFRAGIEAGIVDHDEIVQWADSVLNLDEPYIDCIADLSFRSDGNIQRVYDLLGEVPGTLPNFEEFWEELRSYIGMKLKSGTIEPESVVRHIDWHYHGNRLPEDVEKKISEFTSDYNCVLDGVGSGAEVDSRVLAYFTEEHNK